MSGNIIPQGETLDWTNLTSAPLFTNWQTSLGQFFDSLPRGDSKRSAFSSESAICVFADVNFSRSVRGSILVR